MLALAQDTLGEKPALIVVDDFYHVPYKDQPNVLAYLHQIVKNLNIFLKALDITLSQFSSAQTFLEAVLAGISEPLGIEIDTLITDGGRQRLVLGSESHATTCTSPKPHCATRTSGQTIPHASTTGSVPRT